jgi:hypothetical protein
MHILARKETDMEDDLVSSLTRQVKEEVLENYLTERRLIELQTEDLQERARQVQGLAADTAKRVARLALLAIRAEMHQELIKVLRIPEPSFWSEQLAPKRSKGVRFIRVTALTSKTRFKKLFLESYRRLYQWMEKYQKAYNELKAECQAANTNIKAFRNNFDLLTIINFLKSLDAAGIEKKHFLGENFTAQEMASVDQKLYIHSISFEKLDVPVPLSLPAPKDAEHSLNEFSSAVYEKYESQAKSLIR